MSHKASRFQIISFLSLLLILNFFSACKDPCEDVECFRGTCVDGECECLTGYTGDECRERLTTKRLKIDNIRLTEMPNYIGSDTTIDWNLYIVVTRAFLDTIYIHPTTYMDVDPSKDYDFIPNEDIYFDSLNITSQFEKYRIYLLNETERGRPGDFVSGTWFSPGELAKNYPQSIVLSTNSSTFAIDITYIFE